jgi:hypothetical protein
MNTRNSKILTGLLLIGTLFLHTACPDKGSNRGVTTAPPPPGPCVSGQPCVQSGTGTLIAQALGRYYSSGVDVMHLGLIFSQTAVTGGSIGQPYYYGQAVAVGTLTVRAPVQRIYCPIPPGSYQVVTVTPATWQAYSFADLRIEARGPVLLQIRLPNNFITSAAPPIIGADGISYPYRLQNTILVDSINGISCNGSGIFVLE